MTQVRINRFPLQSAFDHLLNDAFDMLTTPARNVSRPAANIVETEKGYEVGIAAPGVTKDDLKIKVDKNILSISATKEVSNEENKPNYKHREFSITSFERTFTLPEHVDVDQIEATFENGILKVALPKKAELLLEPKTISVK